MQVALESTVQYLLMAFLGCTLPRTTALSGRIRLRGVLHRDWSVQVILIQEQLSKNRIIIDLDSQGRLVSWASWQLS